MYTCWYSFAYQHLLYVHNGFVRTLLTLRKGYSETAIQHCNCSSTFPQKSFYIQLLIEMVFKGQDAWRKHPLLANCSRTPFPVFGLAVKIFAAYVALDCYVKFITGKSNKFNVLHASSSF